MSHHGIPDNLQLVIPTEETEKAARIKQQRTRRVIILVVVLIILGILISCGVAINRINKVSREVQEQMISGFSGLADSIENDSNKIKEVLQKFMNAMAEADIESATEYLTRDATVHLKSDLNKMIEQGNHLLFKDYTTWILVDIDIKQNTYNPTSVANVVFEILYEDGSSAIFTAICEEWDDEWQIESLQLDHFIGLSASN